MQRLPAITACILLFSTCVPVLVVAQATGPRLQFTPPVAVFDTASCGAQRSVTVTIRNTGDAEATISTADAVVPPFTGTFLVPLILSPGASRDVILQYLPENAPGKDSLEVQMVADNPVPTALGFLFDVSSGMAAPFGSGTCIEAAHDASVAFLDNAMAAGAPTHEAGAYAYSSASQFRLLRGFTTDRSMTQGAFPSSATGIEACPWDAMHRTIGFLQTRPLRKMLIVFSASEDAGLQSCGPHSAAGIISSAVAAGVNVHCIAFTDEEESKLRDIAAQTGGTYARVTDAADLAAAMDAILSMMQYDVPQTYVLQGTAVAPVLRITPDHLVFPTTVVGAEEVLSFVLHNDGNATLHVYGTARLPEYMTLVLPPESIPPGDSATVMLRFMPQTPTYGEAHVTFSYNACGVDSETIIAYGVGYAQENPDVGPVLEVTDSLLFFADVDCSASRVVAFPVRNPGNKVVSLDPEILEGDRFEFLSTVRNLPPGASEDISLRFRPEGWVGRDTATLRLPTVSRATMSTVVVTDAGAAARLTYDGGLLYHEAMQLALGELIAGMGTTRTLEDEMAIYASGNRGANLLQPFTGNKEVLAALELSSAPVDSSCVISTLEAALDLLRTEVSDRRIILFTAMGDPDAAACPDTNLAGVIDQAVAAKVPVHTISLGSQPATALEQLAVATGGTFMEAGTFIRLREQLEIVEAYLASARSFDIQLLARSVSSLLQAPEELPPFPDTRVGESSCTDMTIRNAGDGPLIISAVEFLGDDFAIYDPLPIIVGVGDSTSVHLCFTPRLPGDIVGGVRFVDNSCFAAQTPVFLSGSAWDSSSVSIEGSFAVRPGSIVRIPVTLTSPVDENYGLRNIDFSIAYNPTLLYPDDLLPAEAADGGSLLGSNGRIDQGFDPATGRATTTYHIRRSAQEAPITTQTGNHLLGWLRLRSFLGNATETTVVLDTVQSHNTGLTMSVRGEATIRLDSMYWLEQRLVDPSALYGVTLGKHWPNPVRGEAVLPYHLQRETSLRLSVYDSFGRRVAVVEEGVKHAGMHQAVFDSHMLPSGVYYYRLETADGALTRSMLISR